MVQPDSMSDDLGGKAMAIVRVGWRLHAITIVRLPPSCQAGYRDNALLNHHLDPERMDPPTLLSGMELRHARDYAGRLLRAADPELERLHAVVDGLGYSVLLADRSGVSRATCGSEMKKVAENGASGPGHSGAKTSRERTGLAPAWPSSVRSRSIATNTSGAAILS